MVTSVYSAIPAVREAYIIAKAWCNATCSVEYIERFDLHRLTSAANNCMIEMNKAVHASSIQ